MGIVPAFSGGNDFSAYETENLLLNLTYKTKLGMLRVYEQENLCDVQPAVIEASPNRRDFLAKNFSQTSINYAVIKILKQLH